METFAVHFNAISGSNWVQGLVDEESMAPKPHQAGHSDQYAHQEPLA